MAAPPLIMATFLFTSSFPKWSMVQEKDWCLKCDKSWSRNSDSPDRGCPGCGARDWNQEYSLEQHVGARNDYNVVEERVGEGHLMTLMLQGTWNPAASAMAPLCHRLKEDYRHRKNDLGVKDGRELVVTFDRATSGPNAGRWIFADIRRRPPPTPNTDPDRPTPQVEHPRGAGIVRHQRGCGPESSALAVQNVRCAM